ncbi:hypothetical protein [Haloferula sp. BvORR071]|uniref:hypothetical protein n=1 Tax=Haloferula sp. BvORR071 TaxID=1396141 RepID=UPI002240E87A|nr:hypothetical protein [Haloferula sp. BvORR071]
MLFRSLATDPNSRSRSVHDKRPYNVAVTLTLLHYLCVVGFLTSLVILSLNPKVDSVELLIGFVVATGVTWLIAYLKRRSARCPLCKGTPLLDTGASKHAKAYRLRPLNYGSTAVLGILFLHRFRCMYCGTPYDLLKKPSSQRYH